MINQIRSVRSRPRMSRLDCIIHHYAIIGCDQMSWCSLHKWPVNWRTSTIRSCVGGTHVPPVQVT